MILDGYIETSIKVLGLSLLGMAYNDENVSKIQDVYYVKNEDMIYFKANDKTVSFEYNDLLKYLISCNS